MRRTVNKILGGITVKLPPNIREFLESEARYGVRRWKSMIDIVIAAIEAMPEYKSFYSFRHRCAHGTPVGEQCPRCGLIVEGPQVIE